MAAASASKCFPFIFKPTEKSRAANASQIYPATLELKKGGHMSRPFINLTTVSILIRHGRDLAHGLRDSVRVFFEILVEAAREVARFLVIGRFVCPGVARL